MIRNAFRANGGRVLLLLIALGSLPAGWWLRDALSARTEPAIADVPVVKCEELVKTFDAYPLVYLGDSFEGLPLNYCRRRQEGGTPDGRIPATDSFAFVYGDCTIKPGRSSCAYPLQVIIDSRCAPPLPFLGTETIRGGEAQAAGAGALAVKAPLYRVKISVGIQDAAGEALVRRAFLELRGANALAEKLTVGDSLADQALVSAPEKDKDACDESGNVKEPPPEAVVSGSQLDLVVTDNGASLTVLLDLSGTVSSAYTGAQITFDVPSALLSFGSGSAAGGLSGGVCVNAVKPDTPALGRTQVNFGCSLLAAKTSSATGTLLSVTMTEIGNGCADIVLDTALTTINDSSGELSSTYGVSAAQIATVGTGGVCPP